MREIKFRAWMKESKSMIFLTATAFGDLVDNHKTGFEIMQYTGLKDKNVKEIYEGDILKNEDGVSVVYFDDGSFYPYNVVYGDTIDYCWELYEVIGNKFENPELL